MMDDEKEVFNDGRFSLSPKSSVSVPVFDKGSWSGNEDILVNTGFRRSLDILNLDEESTKFLTKTDSPPLGESKQDLEKRSNDQLLEITSGWTKNWRKGDKIGRGAFA